MNREKHLDLLQDWFAYTFIEAVKTLPKVLNDPKQATREMNRLKRHSDYQLQETFKIAEEELA